MKNKDVHVVGTVGVPACYGGFESLVENLIEDSTFNYTVYCSAKAYPNKAVEYKSAKLVYYPLSANGGQSILYDIISLIGSARRRADVVLVLGVSGCLFLPILKIFSNARIVTNIDGLEWKRDKWSPFAKWFLKISESFAVRFSDKVVSDNVAIAKYVEDEYGVTSEVIAYGGDHAIVKGAVLNGSVDGYALGLCRIEPENNVHLILEAFSKSGDKLVFIGNWNASQYGRELKGKFSKFANISILDPIYDISRLHDIRAQCGLYVHGHSAGGTNPSLVEMMHFGKPILCFDCAYNRATTENSAEYFTDVETLVKLMASSDFSSDSNGIGTKMKDIAGRRYTWDVVRSQYLQLFK
ncbi:DUF1972 domain-containing protein [Ferrimonas balearica]|uniref:DUF1972 domain-containing protein n=1 Tax=Ferrimonas balearica TaxID=44012 RepID=UPI001C99635F|nr:DUF1972 domain-containing protein [Ferrimonas balearica]MBY5990775.1 DUF1972 domain-containing protein [Ferrimonas balearica]